MRAAFVASFGVAVCGIVFALWKRRRRRSVCGTSLFDCVGNTPMIELQSLSSRLGCRVFAKLEFLNPGGTSKDRAAKQIILDAEQSHFLGRPVNRTRIYEGSAGSTGISLALLGAARGYNITVFIPSDMAVEKSQLLQALGATVTRVPPAPFLSPEHFCNAAKRAAAADPTGFFSDQFDNLSNFRAHYLTTGPEMWQQMLDYVGGVDCFVGAAGTGGLIAGVSRCFKEHNPAVSVVLADPQGSSLYLKVNAGVAFSDTELEGKRKREQVDTIVEGIGQVGRVTKNFSEAQIDCAVRCTDQECVDMSRFIMRHEGIFLGSSSAAHLVGVVKAARLLPAGSRIVTVLCDAGWRHASKFWNDDFLQKQNLKVKDAIEDLSFVE
jgi:cysteine synthase A